MGRLIRKLLLVAALSATLLSAFSSSAAAQQGAAEAYSLMAVQNRRHFGTHEFAVFGGLLPMDAFSKGATLSGSYTIHFSTLFAWEVFHALNSFHYDGDLKDDLDAFELDPTPFEVVDRVFTTNLLFKPVYWKGAWLNDSVIHGEFYGIIGGGYGLFTRSERPAFDVGLGMRLYLSELFSLRLDVRHHLFVKDSVFDFELHDEIWIGLGIAVAL